MEINMEIIEKKNDLSLYAWHPMFFLYWGMQLKPKGE